MPMPTTCASSSVIAAIVVPPTAHFPVWCRRLRNLRASYTAAKCQYPPRHSVWLLALLPRLGDGDRMRSVPSNPSRLALAPLALPRHSGFVASASVASSVTTQQPRQTPVALNAVNPTHTLTLLPLWWRSDSRAIDTGSCAWLRQVQTGRQPRCRPRANNIVAWHLYQAATTVPLLPRC